MEVESARQGAASEGAAGVQGRPTKGAAFGARFRALAARFERGVVVPWVRGGASWWLFVAAAWLLPFMCAGAIRAVTRLPLTLALVVALLGLAAVVMMFRLRPRLVGATDESGRWFEWGGGALGALAIAGAFHALYNPGLGALAAYYGLDGGTHFVLSREFATKDPQVYNGFITLYAVMELVGRIVPGPIGGLAAAFYGTVAVVMITPVVAMVALLRPHARAGWAPWAGLLVFAFAWFLMARAVVLPLLSNMQVDGFYGHFFGFVPFAFIWAADLALAPLALRLVAMGAGIILCRFTYGLNLGDVLVACGVIWLFDGLRAGSRVIPLAAGAAAVAGALVVYRSLQPIFPWGGYVEIYSLDELLPSMRVAAAALVVFAAIDALSAGRVSRPGAVPAPGLCRVVRLPALFALVAWVALLQFSKVPRCESYYRLKYPLMPLVWLGAAACIAAGYAVFAAASRARAPIVAVAGMAAVAVFALLSPKVDTIFAVMQAELEERSGAPPHPKMRPLVDPFTWKTIDDTLKATGKTFGGLVSSDYPVSHVLNALRDFDEVNQLFYPPVTTPGHCVFWTRPQDDAPFAWMPQKPAEEAARAALSADPTQTCAEFTPAWAVVPHVLCHRCY